MVIDVTFDADTSTNSVTLFNPNRTYALSFDTGVNGTAGTNISSISTVTVNGTTSIVKPGG